jgi:xanthine/uracil permease
MAYNENSEGTANADFPFDVGVDEKLPLVETLVLSVQNISVMATMMIFPGILGRAFHLQNDKIAYLYGICFMICGITTVFQSVILLRLPVVQGPWAPTFSAIIVLGHLPGSTLGAAFGSFFIASLIWCVFSIPVKGASLIGLVSRYFLDPLVSGVIIVLAMIQLANATVPHWLGEPKTPGFPEVNILAGLISVVIFMALMVKGGVILRRSAVLISMAIGSCVFFAFQPGHFHSIGGSLFLIIPEPFAFGFGVKPVFVLIFLLTLIPTGVQSIAMYELVSGWIGQSLSVVRVSQGVFGMALGAMLASIFGSFSTVFYATNLSLLQSTKVASRYVTLSTGLLLVILGGFAKVDMLFAMIPGPVISAVSTVLFGIVFAHGARMIFSGTFDDRKFMVVGLSLFLGLGGLFVPQQTLDSLPVLVQTIIAQPVILGGSAIVFLYPLLCRRKTTVLPQIAE